MKNKILYTTLVLFTAFLMSCEEVKFSYTNSLDADFSSVSDGVGGSFARFTVVNDYMYTVTNNSLNIFNISDLENEMQFVGKINLAWEVETIFPLQNKLFIGTMSGMYIFDISTPTQPILLSSVQHIVSCDPVVADNKHAYVTLHSSGSRCGRNTNELQIYDINEVENPKLVNQITMENPLGLGITDTLLFVCDKSLKVYDRTDPINPFLIKSFAMEDPYDVIPLNDILMVTSGSGIYQYGFNNDTIEQLSLIPILGSN